MRTRRNMLMFLALFAVAGLAMGLAGCPKEEAKEGDAGGSAAIVNTRCPMMPARSVPADTELTRTFQGKTVGFCCAGCPAEWDALSDEEKEAKLAAVCGCGDGEAAQCTGEEGCQCPTCTATAAAQCTGEEGCQCAACTAAAAIQCTGEEGCQCAHCAAEAEVEAVQCTGEADCACPHCAS